MVKWRNGGIIRCNTFSLHIFVLQGMDMVTRKTGRHIETEPDYEGAFTLQIRMMPVYTLVYEWCFSDVSDVYRMPVK